MAFDPSVIAQIPDGAPNPAAAKQAAYTLASQMDQETIHRLQLKEAEQTHDEEERAKQIVKTSPNNTAQDRLATAEKLRTQVGPDYSNRYLKEIQGIESGDYAIQLQKLQIASQQQEALVGAMDGVITQIDEFKLQNPGATPAMLNAKVQEFGTPAMQALAQQRPDLRPAIAQFAQSPQAATYEGWKSAESATKEGRERITMRLNEHKQDLADRAEVDKERRTDIEQQRADTADAKQKADADAQKEGAVNDEDAKDMADQYIAGDKSVLVGLSRGKYGSQNMNKVRHFIRTESDRMGLSPVDRAARMAAFSGLMAEEQTAGRRQATIQIAADEFTKITPIVESRAKEVNRGNWVPVNTIIQKLDTMRSDPKLGAFAQAIDTTVNVYARAIAPTGVPHEAARARALQILSTATSEADFEAKLEVMKEEVDAALKAPDEVRERILDSFKKSVAPRPGSPAAQQAAAAAAAQPGGGAPPPPPPAGAGTDYSHLWNK